MEQQQPSKAVEFIGGIAEKLGVTAKAATIFGEPVERDGITIIPVAKARWGLVVAPAAKKMKMEQEAAAVSRHSSGLY